MTITVQMLALLILFPCLLLLLWVWLLLRLQPFYDPSTTADAAAAASFIFTPNGGGGADYSTFTPDGGGGAAAAASFIFTPNGGGGGAASSTFTPGGGGGGAASTFTPNGGSGGTFPYKVFLSFRGEDTRHNFVSHLYKELTQKGIHTFKDDHDLKKGDSLTPSLLEAISDSRVVVVVLSEHYASSTWCLDELVKIMECRKRNRLLVVPIFYRVDPSDVRNQRGNFGKAFKMHRKKRKQEKNYEAKMEKWRNVLTEVATVAGWDSRNRNEATFIEDVVTDISNKLVCATTSDAACENSVIGSLYTGSLVECSLKILLQATNNFSEDCKIGTGSFGSVYRGTLDDGCQVAIKRAEVSITYSYAIGTRHQEDKDNAFISELELLSRIHHKNLVRLLGFCEDSNERILVYEYVENGTLHHHLHSLENSPLQSWPARIKVALDAARGIEYLHEYTVPPIIHRDIKSSNILLDSTWTAKVCDFGLSLMGPEDEESHLSLLAAGTVGYMDPEYYRLQQLSTKSDVYSFGVVLLEMLSGCKAIHRNENGVPRNVVDVVVPYIFQDQIHRVLDCRLPPPTPSEIESVAYVGYLAGDCVTLESRDRPSMRDIVISLERALAACLVHQTPFSRSTTGSSD